jgi:hypothetical protein
LSKLLTRIEPTNIVKFIRRVLAALTATLLAAGAIRLRGSGGTPPQHGGWKPLELPEQ